MDEQKLFNQSIETYFKMIQNVISRMAQNSFKIKAWYTTIFAAIIVLSFTYILFLFKFMIFIVLIVIGVLFWYLDSYYLQQERLFRRLYNSQVILYNKVEERFKIQLYDLNVKRYKSEEQSIVRIMISTSEICFYSPFIGILITLLVFDIILF